MKFTSPPTPAKSCLNSARDAAGRVLVVVERVVDQAVADQRRQSQRPGRSSMRTGSEASPFVVASSRSVTGYGPCDSNCCSAVLQRDFLLVERIAQLQRQIFAQLEAEPDRAADDSACRRTCISCAVRLLGEQVEAQAPCDNRGNTARRTTIRSRARAGHIAPPRARIVRGQADCVRRPRLRPASRRRSR